MTQHAADMAALMDLPAFRRFLFRSIQSSGLLRYSGASANGTDGRDLAFAEGRRSLGLELLRDAEAAFPAPLQQPPYAHVMIAVLAEGASQPSEKPNARRDRYADLDGDDGDGDAR